jgi:hypothetical protein
MYRQKKNNKAFITGVKYSKWVKKPAKYALERPRNQIQARYIQTGSDKSRKVTGAN